VIHNGVDMVVTNGRSGQTHNRYLLYVGRIDPDKSVDDLVSLYSRSGCPLPLVVAGGGSELDRLQTRHRSANITFLGRKQRAELPALFEGAVAFVTASSYETFCLPVIEAAACGVPSIGPSSGSLPEVIRHGTTGWLYSSEAEFRQHVLQVSSMDQQQLARIGDQCRVWARQFTWSSRAERYLEVYRSISAEGIRGAR
jgi:glycosyltransferase involved in cell wall biosynthesis